MPFWQEPQKGCYFLLRASSLGAPDVGWSYYWWYWSGPLRVVSAGLPLCGEPQSPPFDEAGEFIILLGLSSESLIVQENVS